MVAIHISIIDDIKKVHMKNTNIRGDMSVERKEKLSLLNKNQFMLLYTDEAIRKIMTETDKVLKSDVPVIQKDKIDFSIRRKNNNSLYKYNHGKTQKPIKIKSIEEIKQKAEPSEPIKLTAPDI
jgi:hypothetical protein